jgi:PmbA protein
MDVFGELRSQAEQVEVVSLNSESTTVGFEANRLKTSQIDETTGVAARVVRDGRLGFAASGDSRAVQQLVANVLESAEFGDRIPLASLAHDRRRTSLPTIRP